MPAEAPVPDTAPKVQKYTSVDELMGKIEGIERTILIEEEDTLLNTIEKIALIPDSKLIHVIPI